MNHEQMCRVLAKCALFDGRTVVSGEVGAWHDAVGDLDFADAMAAVPRFFAANRRRMWPADLKQTVEAISAERAAGNSPAGQGHT
jgi:hypothetical protein